LGLEVVHTSMRNAFLSVRTAFLTYICELTLAVVVLISLIVRIRGNSHATVSPLWRLQLYTFCAFVIASICQRHTGKLSSFDEIVTYHTGALLLWSAVVGMMIQEGDSPLTPQHKVSVSIGTGRRRIERNIVLPTLTPWFILVGCLAYMALAWVIFFKDSSCDNGPVHWMLWRKPVIINGTNKGSLWVLVYLFAPMVAFILIPLVLRAAPCCKRFFSLFCAYVLPVAYLLLWIKEIYSIERSMRINLLDRSAPSQNEWNFGQVISFSLSSIKKR
jgi:hypothetical protein